MGDKSKIEWTDATLNVVTGCSKKRPEGGCKNCYAKRLFPKTYPGRKFEDVQLHPDRLAKAASWRRARMIFLNSMGDTFHEKVPDHYIRQILATIRATPHHIWQVLTKRIERAAPFIKDMGDRVPPNLWIGVSAEDQDSCKRGIEGLLGCGGHVPVRFISLEPLLGRVSLLQAMFGKDKHEEIGGSNCLQFVDGLGYGLDWVITGAESGPNARPMDEDWVRLLRDECEADGLPFMYKQKIVDRKKVSCPELDGRVYREFPKALEERREEPGQIAMAGLDECHTESKDER